MAAHMSILRHYLSFDGLVSAGAVSWCAVVLAEAAYTGRTPVLDATPASQGPEPTKEARLTASQIGSLQDRGYLVVDNFLTKEQVRDACRAIQSLDESGHFKKNPNNDDTVRTDRTFMSKDDGRETKGLQDIRKTVASFARGLADSDFSGFGSHNDYHSSRLNMPHSMQISIFGRNQRDNEAQFFTSHLDSAGTDTFLELGLLGWLRSYYLRKRYLTCIVYLNDDWKPGDGGCLRLHRNTPTQYTFESEDFLDVEPIAGRLVIFSSLHQWHCVLPTFATRFACSFWLTLAD